MPYHFFLLGAVFTMNTDFSAQQNYYFPRYRITFDRDFNWLQCQSLYL